MAFAARSSQIVFIECPLSQHLVQRTIWYKDQCQYSE